jgi:hypothetical protein
MRRARPDHLYSSAADVRQRRRRRVASSVPLNGQGSVTVYLHSPNSPGFPNSWSIQRVVYRFTSALPGLLTSTDVGPVGQAGRGSFNGSQFDVWDPAPISGG